MVLGEEAAVSDFPFGFTPGGSGDPDDPSQGGMPAGFDASSLGAMFEQPFPWAFCRGPRIDAVGLFLGRNQVFHWRIMPLRARCGAAANAARIVNNSTA